MEKETHDIPAVCEKQSPRRGGSPGGRFQHPPRLCQSVFVPSVVKGSLRRNPRPVPPFGRAAASGSALDAA